MYGLSVDESDRVLLVRAVDRAGALGAWRLPGGAVGHGEDPAGALIRAFAEETGLVVTIEGVRDAVADVVSWPEKDLMIHHDRIIYHARIISGVPGGRVSWLDRGQLATTHLRPWVARLLGAAGSDDVSRPPVPVIGGAAVAGLTGADVTRVQRFSAYGLVRDPAGRILLTRIAEGYPGAGSWHLPGGGTDFGERPAEALLREVCEETGQTAEIGALLTVVHAHNPRAYGPEKRHLDWHTVRTIFEVIVPEPTTPVVLQPGGSTDMAAWFTPVEVGKLNLNKLARSIVSDYAK